MRSLALWLTWRKPNGHGVKTQHLTEGGLLTRFNGLCLYNQSCHLLGVEMTEEAPVTRFTPTGELRIKIQELAHSLERVIVSALLGCCFTQHIAE